MISAVLIPAIVLVLVLGSSVVSYRWKLRSLFALVPAALLSLFAGYLAGDLFVFFVPVFLGSFAGFSHRHSKSFQFFILAAALAVTFLNSGQYYYMKAVRGVDMLDLSGNDLARITESWNLPESQTENSGQMLAEWIEAAKYLVPFSSFLYSLFFSLLTFFATKAFLSRFGEWTSQSGLDKYRLNDYTVFLLIGGVAGLIFTGRPSHPVLHTVSLNALLITSMLYFIQALGVIKFFLSRRGLPVIIIPGVLFLIVFLGIPAAVLTGILLTGMGVLDMWVDFRKLTKTEKPQ